MSGIERKVVIDDSEVVCIMEYLQLLLDKDPAIDDRYGDEIGYKVHKHIDEIIKQLGKNCDIMDKVKHG